ncbi:MAG TPA: MBG domain-containing protein, partial [Vineibacter sp.]|nr:MBG domain-containing protein [Vineibacter sp.]
MTSHYALAPGAAWQPGVVRTHVSAIALCVGLGLMTVASVPAAGQSLPTGGQVAAGSVTIGQPVGGAMTVRQTSDRGVVNWQTFNVGAGGRVDFQQPSASSATLNRVTGSTSSVIAGQISANGQVFLVNPNGIQITPSGAVRTGAFVASTLDIKNSDFLSGRTVFEGNGRSAGVVNQGTIETAPGGSVVLMGGRVVNEGTITAEGGRVGLASGERVVVDLQGDGFLQVSVPTADAERTEALIKHTGRIQANGGRVAMRAATTADVARAAITVSGAIEARTVMRTEAGVVFGTDAGAPAPTGPVTVQRGKIEIDGGPGGSVTTSGRISAGSGTQRGGDIRISGNGVTTAGTLDVSGGTVGGTIAVDGGARLDASGAFLASGGTTGGRIDLTADDARVTQASLLATGGSVGGLIRIGGAFQGGKTKDNAPELEATFLARWADVSTLRSATTTRIDSNTSIDVSGGTAGGTAIVWSNDMTWMAGAVKATGALSAGSVEVSGAQTLAFIDLGRLQIGNGGQLLLDPKNITIATSGSAAVAANDQFGDNNSSSVTISPNSLTTLLDAGTAVTLQASTNITVSNAISVNNAAGSGGNLTLQAGRSIIINANITTDNGNLTLIANETVANGVINARRDSGAASLTFAGTTITAGTGTVTILMNTGAGLTNATSGNISLGTIASAGAVNVTYSGPTAAGLIQLNGNITASGNITLSNRSLRVGANSTLTSTGGTVTWAGEGSQTIAGVAGGEQIKVVEGSAITRIGLMDTADAARLAIGQTAPSRAYGDANPAVDTLRLVSGTLRAGDTLGGILAAGSTATTWSGGAAPAAAANVGSYGYTVTASGAIAINATERGYFITTTTSGSLSVTARPITVKADALTKIYGDADPALTWQITNGNLVGTDTLSGSLARAVGETVTGGPYAITQGTLANGNYAISFTGATFTITPASLNVAATARTKVYGDADPALTFTASGFKFSDTAASVLTGSVSRTAGETVAAGPYAITQGSLAANTNYSIIYTGANLTITPASLNVAANARTKVYGDADPALTFTATGLRFSDTAAGVLTGTLSRDAGETASGSPYAITRGSLAANANYTIVYTGANLTITPAPLNVTANARTKVYGDVDPALTFTATGFKFSDTTASVLTGGLSRSAGESVAGGPYAITQGSLAANANYSTVYTGANLTITPAPLNVTANSQTKV